MASSGRFFHARESSEILPEKLVLKPNRQKRTALAERSSSQINTENSEQPTIRLVDGSSSPTIYEKTPFPQIQSQVLKPPKTTKHGYTIQNNDSVLHLDERLRDRSSSPKRRSKLLPSALSFRHPNRGSTATTVSNSDTLLNDSLFSPTSNRFSQDGTLRNTPTPQAMEERQREREEEDDQALEEVPKESSTIRPVTGSSGSSQGSNPRNSGILAIHPAFRNDMFPRRDRLSSIQSVDSPSTSSPAISNPEVEGTSSEYSEQFSSSSPSAARSSSYNIIRYATPDDSTSIQYPEVRPPTATSQSTDSVWSSSNNESLPPLTVPRRRLHVYSASAGPVFNPNRPLSTILSEAEPSSRSNTQARFDPGSRTEPGQMRHRRVKTMGSSSFISRTASSQYDATSSSNNSQADLSMLSLMRAQSALPPPLFSSSARNSKYEATSEPPSKETEGEGDDTIAELQDRPALRTKHSGHLIRRGSTSDLPPGTSKSNYTLAEADRTSQGSSIFPQWAKQFYRGRSTINSANASKISLSRPGSPVRMMPWARHRRFDSEWESYDTSGGSVFDSRPETRSDFYSPANSSHFLPSIFRPNTRRRAYTDVTRESHSQSHSSDEYYDQTPSTSSGPRSGPLRRGSSLEITPARPRSADAAAAAAYHPSPLASSPRREKVPRSKKQQGKQRKRTPQGELLRSNTFASSTLRYPSSSLFPPNPTPPHLAPSRRLSHRLSAWRAPSFDEALSTLIISRQNRQILFFCIGFLCPLLWMVGAVLPIPPRPLDARMNSFFGTESEVGASAVEDEGVGARYAVPIDMFDWELERGYLKARWWRNLNRVMSVVGVIVVAVIVSFTPFWGCRASEGIVD